MNEGETRVGREQGVTRNLRWGKDGETSCRYPARAPRMRRRGGSRNAAGVGYRRYGKGGGRYMNGIERDGKVQERDRAGRFQKQDEGSSGNSRSGQSGKLETWK